MSRYRNEHDPSGREAAAATAKKGEQHMSRLFGWPPPDPEHGGRPWIEPTAQLLRAAFRDKESILVAWHDGWRECKIVSLDFRGVTHEDRERSKVVRVIVVQTKRGGHLNLEAKHLKTSVLVLAPKPVAQGGVSGEAPTPF